MDLGGVTLIIPLHDIAVMLFVFVLSSFKCFLSAI